MEIEVAWAITYRGRPMTPDQGAFCVRVGPPPSAAGGWLTLRGPDDATTAQSIMVRPDGWAIGLGLAPGVYRVSGVPADAVGEVAVEPGRCTFGELPVAATPSSPHDLSHRVARRRISRVVLADLDPAAWDGVAEVCGLPHRPTWTTAHTAAWTDLPLGCTPVLRLRRRGEPTVRWEVGHEAFGVGRWAVTDPAE